MPFGMDSATDILRDPTTAPCPEPQFGGFAAGRRHRLPAMVALVASAPLSLAAIIHHRPRKMQAKMEFS